MKTKYEHLLTKTNVVGVVTSESDLCDLSNHLTGCRDHVDLVEWRLDILHDSARDMHKLRKRIKEVHRPVILTVRSCAEGGAQCGWTDAMREMLYTQNLSVATFVDVEASAIGRMPSLLKIAREQGVGLIVSYHNFTTKFSLTALERAAMVCSDVEGSILKLAFKADTYEQFEKYVHYVGRISRRSKVPVAAMAMGKFGKVSRLLFGISGSPLIYGYINDAPVEGQWHISQIKNMLSVVSS